MITMPTLILRGQYDGIAAFDDLVEFFKRLPHPDKQFTVMAGISHASFQQKNYLTVYHILHSFFSQPEPAYRRSNASLSPSSVCLSRMKPLHRHIRRTRPCTWCRAPRAAVPTP